MIFELILSPLFRNIALLPFLVAALLVCISIPAVIQIANYFGLVDDPKKRPHPAHTESRVIPRAGGLAIFMGTLIATVIFIPFAKGIFGIMLGGLLLTFVGILDDKKDVPPYIRIGVNIMAACLAVAGGAGLGFITNPLDGTVLRFDTLRWSFEFLGPHSILPIADILAIGWLVWSMNMIGWSTGVDGQMPGFVVITAVIIGLLSFSQISIENFPAWTGTTLAFITAGAYLGFLPWNFFPQKIMPGYGGKALAGYLLGTLAILSSVKFGTALLVLAVPAIDSIYVGLSRIFKGQNPMLGGRNHLQHRLLDAGWAKWQIALFYWSVSGILGVIALNVNSRQKFFTVLVVAVVLLGTIIWLKLSSTSLKRQDPGSGLKT